MAYLYVDTVTEKRLHKNGYICYSTVENTQSMSRKFIGVPIKDGDILPLQDGGSIYSDGYALYLLPDKYIKPLLTPNMRVLNMNQNVANFLSSQGYICNKVQCGGRYSTNAYVDNRIVYALSETLRIIRCGNILIEIRNI